MPCMRKWYCGANSITSGSPFAGVNVTTAFERCRVPFWNDSSCETFASTAVAFGYGVRMAPDSCQRDPSENSETVYSVQRSSKLSGAQFQKNCGGCDAGAPRGSCPPTPRMPHEWSRDPHHVSCERSNVVPSMVSVPLQLPCSVMRV